MRIINCMKLCYSYLMLGKFVAKRKCCPLILSLHSFTEPLHAFQFIGPPDYLQKPTTMHTEPHYFKGATLPYTWPLQYILYYPHCIPALGPVATSCQHLLQECLIRALHLWIGVLIGHSSNKGSTIGIK
jgi:hypothetical protein